MRKLIRPLALIVCGFLIGIIADRLFAMRLPYFYRTTRDLHLLLEGARSIGTLPANAPLLAPRQLRGNPKLGWWACLPVRMGVESEAEKIVAGNPDWSGRDPMLWLTTSEEAEVFPWPAKQRGE